TPKLRIRNWATAGLLFLAAGFFCPWPLAGGQRLFDRELVQLAAFFDKRRGPPRADGAARPGLAPRSPQLKGPLPPLSARAASKYGSRNTGSMAAFSPQPRKLLFQFAALLTKPFVNVGAQCKQRVNVHTF